MAIDFNGFVTRSAEAGHPLMIVETLRTPEEHAANLAAGRPWTQHSKHLDGLAIDVAPYDLFQIHGGNKLIGPRTMPCGRCSARSARSSGCGGAAGGSRKTWVISS